MSRPHPDPLPIAPILEMGSGDRSVLFLHGLFGSPAHWTSIMEGLQEEYRLIAPQLPIDRAQNRRQEGVKSISELTDMVEATIDHMGLERFVLCGNSLGGLIAIDLALRHPDRVVALVLAGSAGLYERSLTNGVKPKPTREFVRSVISDIFFDDAMITEALIDEWFQIIQDRDYARFILRISRATRDRCVEEELGQLKMPTMILWGREDQITPPEVAHQFQEKIPRSRLHFIDRCGHSPNVEQPAIFAEHLKGFLAEQWEHTKVPRKPR
jgi:pimeloyl-ACP methyl ester carboxylesterase